MSTLAELHNTNFAKATISGSFTGATTSFTVLSGHGSRLPVAPFRFTIAQDNDFPDPTDAFYSGPQAEICECTAIVGDTMTTVVRAREGTAAISSVAGKTYKIFVTPTAAWLNSVVAGVFNPRAYGGIGDGSANDTTALLTMIAACKAAGGGVMYLPDGDWRCDGNQLLFDFSNWVLTGSKKAKLTLRDPAYNKSLIKIIGTAGAEIENIRIDTIELDGNRAAGTLTAAAAGHGIDIYNVKHCWIQDMFIHDFMGDGIQGNFNGGLLSELWISRVLIKAVLRNGISLVGGNEKTFLTDVIVDGYGTVGIDLEPNNPINAQSSNEFCRDVQIRGGWTKPNATRLNTFNSDRLYGYSLQSPSRLGTVTDATNANPIVITLSENYLDYQTDELVVISGVLGNLAANGFWKITRIDSTHFSIPTIGTGTYTSGGSTDAIRRAGTTDTVTIVGAQAKGLFASDSQYGPSQAPRGGFHAYRWPGISIAACQAIECGVGFSMGSEGSTHQYGNVGGMEACYAARCTSVGFSFHSNWALTACIAEDGQGAGFQIIGGHNSLSACHARNNGKNTALTAAERSGFWISNNDNDLIGCNGRDDQESSPGVLAPTQQHGIYCEDGLDGLRINGGRYVGNAVSAIRRPTGLRRNAIDDNFGDGGIITTGTAAPGSLAWVAGDRVYNSAPASGQPLGWECVSSGSPGTWKAMANLA